VSLACKVQRPVGKTPRSWPIRCGRAALRLAVLVAVHRPDWKTSRTKAKSLYPQTTRAVRIRRDELAVPEPRS
jgi:hypothetical protein